MSSEETFLSSAISLPIKKEKEAGSRTPFQIRSSGSCDPASGRSYTLRLLRGFMWAHLSVPPSLQAPRRFLLATCCPADYHRPLFVDISLLQVAQDVQRGAAPWYQLHAIDFGRRMVIEKELKKTENVPQPNAIIDENSIFLIYATLLGIKLAVSSDDNKG